MRIKEFITESLRTENPCWKGYHPVGTKKKNGRTVPNCVPGKADESVEEGQMPKTWHDVDKKLGKQVDKMSQAEKVKKGFAHPDTLKKKKGQGVAEGTGVTDYNPKSQGGTRKELLAKYHKTKNPKDAEAARKAGATQKELQGVAEASSPAQQAAIAIAMKKKGQKPKKMSEHIDDGDYDSEYDDEAGMADNNLETLRRAIDGIDEVIQPGDNLPEWCQEKIAQAKGMLVSVWDYMKSEEDRGAMAEDWQKVNKKDKTDGMSPKAVKAYRRENPGSKLQTAVTTKPSKLKAGSKDAKRRKSFCARMSGNKGPMKDEKGRPTPKAKALKRWNCE